jgi:antitoxin VapB
MAFSIKNDETDLLVRQLVAITGESLTDAVTIAVRERLERTQRRRGGSKLDRIRGHAAVFAALPVLDGRTPDEILAYDDAGLPT